MRLKSVVVVVSIGFILGLHMRAEAQSYSVRNLGIIPGAMNSRVTAMNDDGPTVRIVGTTSDKFARAYHGFYWDLATGAMVDLGAFAPGVSSTPVDVNSLGEVVGRAPTTATGGNSRAFYWKPSMGPGGLQALPFPAGFANGSVVSSSASSINEAGTIAGSVYRQDLGALTAYWQRDAGGAYQCYVLDSYPGSSVTNSGGGTQINENGDIASSAGSPTTAGNSRAAFWANSGSPATPAYGTPTDAGLPSESVWPNSYGQFINNTGQVLGGFDDSTGHHRFVWTPGTNPQVFDAAGVLGFNNAGSAVGWTYAFAGGAQRGYIYLNGVVTNLGTLGGTTSGADGLNDLNEVVGWAATGGRSSTSHAYVWRNGVMQDLHAATPSRGDFKELTIARRITNSGRIAGEGTLSKGGWVRACLWQLIP